jgi:cytochrome c5
MKHPNSIRRILVIAAALVAVVALTFGATGCTAATGSTPSAQSVAPVTAPAAPAAAPAPAATTAAPAAAAAPSGPTAAEGQQVVKSSCIGQCHGPSLLNKRYSAAKAQSIASNMGRTAGLDAAQKAAIVAYFAQ